MRSREFSNISEKRQADVQRDDDAGQVLIVLKSPFGGRPQILRRRSFFAAAIEKVATADPRQFVTRLSWLSPRFSGQHLPSRSLDGRSWPTAPNVAAGLSAISALRVRRPIYGITRVPLLERLQLCCLSVDNFEHDITRLQLSVRQELRIAEYRTLDGLAADRFGHRLAIKRFGRLDGAGPDL